MINGMLKMLAGLALGVVALAIPGPQLGLVAIACGLVISGAADAWSADEVPAKRTKRERTNEDAVSLWL